MMKQQSTTSTFGLDKNKMTRFIKIVFLFVLIPIVGLAQDGLRYEVVNGDTISIFRYPSATDFNLMIDVTVEESEGAFLYKYTLHNAENSRLSVRSFRIITDYKPLQVDQPESWYGRFGGLISAISWSATDTTKLIQPGVRIDGFEFSIDRLPSILEFHSRGWVPTPRLFNLTHLKTHRCLKTVKKDLHLDPGFCLKK